MKNYIQETEFENKFRIVDFLDSARWPSIRMERKGGSAINFALDEKEYSADEKLLIYWLCYITERQMDYHVIWDKGGVVFSDAVKRYTTYKNFHDFYPRNCGFFKSVLQEEYTFSSITEFRNLCDSCKKKLKRYYRKTQIADNDFVEFKSRFYTSDYVSILYTFYILASYDYSIIKYMSMAIDAVDGITQDINKTEYYVKSIGYALYRLTYNVADGEDCKYFRCNTEQVTKTNIEKFVSDCFIKLAEKRLENIKRDFENNPDFKRNLDDFYNGDERYYSMKRVWCSLRGYLKDDYFKPLFRDRLVEMGKIEAAELLFTGDNSACRYIELPGDVWNENTKFRQCMTIERKGKLGNLLRDIYEKENIKIGYPEQFDVTFDFAPRMCEAEKCDICPFGKLKSNSDVEINTEKISALCVNNEEKYCPLMLLYCGYYFKCVGQECFLKRFFTE